MRKRLTDGQTGYPPDSLDHFVYGKGTSRGRPFAEAEDDPIPDVIVVDAADTSAGSDTEDDPEIPSAKHLVKVGAALLFSIIWIALMTVIDLPTTGKIWSEDYTLSEYELYPNEVEEQMPDVIITEAEKTFLDETASRPEVIQAAEQFEKDGRFVNESLDMSIPFPNIEQHINPNVSPHINHVRYQVDAEGIMTEARYEIPEKGRISVVTVTRHPDGSFSKEIRRYHMTYSIDVYEYDDGKVTKSDFVYHHYGLIDLIRDAIEYYT